VLLWFKNSLISQNENSIPRTEASFTQLTATQLFPNDELIPKANILDCFLAVQNNEVDKAVVPLENSIEGTVSMTLDYLYQTPEIKVEAEAVMPIAHHLMIHPSQENDTQLRKSILIRRHLRRVFIS
jgi:prephenate dehydratase